MFPNSTNKDQYKCFRQFNQLRLHSLASSRSYISPGIANRYFSSDGLQDKLVRALGAQKAIPIKEIFESFEFFQRVRKRVRARCVSDLCCGHGLTGILFALFERCVERVILIDREQPPSHEKVLASAVEVGPWVADKVIYHTSKVDRAAELLEPATSIVAIHACGVLTDRCLDCALETQGAVALMPCCYPDRACEAPQAIQLTLGTGLAFDIDRTYRLQAAGYQVRWDFIPEQISPMNRILVGAK